MIKANELRIGNWVQDQNDAVQVSMVAPDTLHVWRNNKKSDEGSYKRLLEDEVEPIQLTTSILKKAGFEKTMGGNYTMMDEDCWLDENKEGGYDYRVLYSSQPEWMTVASISSLHQLQNLYFALTGEELEMELE